VLFRINSANVAVVDITSWTQVSTRNVWRCSGSD